VLGVFIPHAVATSFTILAAAAFFPGNNGSKYAICSWLQGHLLNTRRWKPTLPCVGGFAEGMAKVLEVACIPLLCLERLINVIKNEHLWNKPANGLSLLPLCAVVADKTRLALRAAAVALPARAAGLSRGPAANRAQSCNVHNHHFMLNWQAKFKNVGGRGVFQHFAQIFFNGKTPSGAPAVPAFRKASRA
jgi:hypothetical protein